MCLPRPIVSNLLLGGWAWLAFCGLAPAQDSQQSVASTRASWQQRVVRHSAAGQTGLTMEGVPRNRSSRRWLPYRAADLATGTERVAMLAAEPGRNSKQQGPIAEILTADDQIELGHVPLVDEADPFGSLQPGSEDCCTCDSACCQPACDGCCPRCGCGWGRRGLHSRRWVRDFSLFAGVHGFKGPTDQGRNGNFGFHEGFNAGGPLGGAGRLGYQLGLQAVHSNFSGDRVAGYRTGDRDQIFFTAGLFHRPVCRGFQWGVAFDLLHDAYYETVDLNQVRTELAYVTADRRREFGFWGAFETRSDSIASGTLRTNDLFAFFYRRHFCGGGEGRLWTGFTSDQDALIGGDIRVPLGRSWALENGLHYLIPGEGRDAQGQSQEAWSVNIQLVWYLGRDARSVRASRFRPLFGVADNSTFIAELR